MGLFQCDHSPRRAFTGEWKLKKEDRTADFWTTRVTFIYREQVCIYCDCRYIETKDIDDDVAEFFIPKGGPEKPIEGKHESKDTASTENKSG